MTPVALFDALDATWPAARTDRLPPFVIRDGQGGGKRVSAAQAIGPVTQDDLARAESAMLALGQPRLFVLRDTTDPLYGMLAAQGYRVIDPTVIRACPIESLTVHHPPRLSAFTLWEPLQIMRDIWAEGGIGPARIAVMEKVIGPRTALLGRSNDSPSGTGFVAVYGGIAMVHALEVRAGSRRQGAARNLMLAAAHWAAGQGARHMAVAVTAGNGPANALYALLGMPICARYHYRIKD